MESLRAMENTRLEMASTKVNGEGANITAGVFSCFLMDPPIMARSSTESPMVKEKRNRLMGQ